MGSELERIERRMIEGERRLAVIEGEMRLVAGLLTRILKLLEEPATYPASNGGTITVT